MEFKEFVEKLASVLRDGSSTIEFTRSVFEAIVANTDLDILDGYKASSFKGFYNGNTSITRISKKINAHLEPMEFAEYISQHDDGAVETLCSVFKTDIPDIELNNAGNKLAELFTSIITEAAGAKRKTTVQQKIFNKYLKKAKSFYSTKKTLLYAEKPHPFYEMYVCNNIRYKNGYSRVILKDATIAKLNSKYVIIQGQGGLGKTMFMTHLFLSSRNATEVPLLLFLKNYGEDTGSIINFILTSIREFDAGINESDIAEALDGKKLVLLMDGLDEIKSDYVESFEKELDVFIKTWSETPVIITSRPINQFISYNKFLLCDILPLEKEQSVKLIEKLEFWDTEAKKNFIVALKNRLYESHRQFASNPLLLTIMLMTYSTFGEIPAKMHVFYSKAYETMSRLHDATKGSYRRKLHTKLSPEDFAKYFAEFCARTYRDQIIEFDKTQFCSYMKMVMDRAPKEHAKIPPRNFLSDLTDNLCIMYKAGEKYYFIHRSFQEYFTAVYFASGFDTKLINVGKIFEAGGVNCNDLTFDMLYDMIPNKVERFIFMPYLEKLLNGKGIEAYWLFLEYVFGELLCYDDAGYLICSPNSFLWTKITNLIDQDSMDLASYTNHPNFISEAVIEEIHRELSNPLDHDIIEGISIYHLQISVIRRQPERFPKVRQMMEKDVFFIMQEYNRVKAYYEKLRRRIQDEEDSDDLFD